MNRWIYFPVPHIGIKCNWNMRKLCFTSLRESGERPCEHGRQDRGDVEKQEFLQTHALWQWLWLLPTCTELISVFRVNVPDSLWKLKIQKYHLRKKDWEFKGRSVAPPPRQVNMPESEILSQNYMWVKTTDYWTKFCIIIEAHLKLLSVVQLSFLKYRMILLMFE